jgi:hypothetical protein
MTAAARRTNRNWNDFVHAHPELHLPYASRIAATGLSSPVLLSEAGKRRRPPT